MSTPRRLLVVHTGGTLAMVPTPDGWAPGADLAGWLAGLVADRMPGLAHDLVVLDPLIDSSNATPASWQRVLDVIASHRDSHDAFVVLHGTDTLGFTAAALSFALSGERVPVVVTGAMRSLVVPGSDAERNVLGALRSALDERLDQVAIFFDDRLLAGHHATKVSSEDDHAFESMNAPAIAQVVGEDLVFPPGGTPSVPALPLPHWPFRDVDVVVVTLHPGLRAQRLAAQLTPAPQAVVLRAYGSGNAPDDDPALIEALRTAHDAGAVVVVTTQCPHGSVHLGRYAVSQGLLSVGAVSGGDLTTDALVAWLSFLLSQGMSPDEVRQTISAWASTSSADVC